MGYAEWERAECWMSDAVAEIIAEKDAEIERLRGIISGALAEIERLRGFIIVPEGPAFTDRQGDT